MTVQQRGLFRQRLQRERESPRLLLARQEFLKQERILRRLLRRLAKPQRQELVAQGEEARGLEPDDRDAGFDIRAQRADGALGLGAGLVDEAGGEEGAAAA